MPGSAQSAADIGFDRVHDLRVARAATEVALERGADRLAIGPRLALEEGQRRQQHAGRAEAALHGAVAHERLLQRVQATVALQPAQRDDGAASQPGGQNEARGHRPPVEQHRADAAHALVAALLDVEDAQRVAQQLEQRLVRAHLDLSRAPVEDEARDHVRPSARATARASAHTGRSATPPKATRASSTRPRRSRLTSATTATTAKSPARRESSSTAQPYDDTASISTPVTISSAVSMVVNGPVKNSRAATVRRPDGDATASRASSAVITAGSSAAGSACTRLPPTVPSVRTRTLPISRAASPSTGQRRAIASDSSSW